MNSWLRKIQPSQTSQMKTKNDSQVGGACAHSRKLLIAGAAMLLSTTLAFGQATKPANETDDKKSDTVHLEKYEVTGSRIKRLDTETVSPVVVMTAESIEAKGFPTFADAIRSMSFNSGQALTPIDAGTSFTPGISTFNLRGLGNNSSLILLNGRRAAAYGAPGFNGFQSMFDLNSTPDAAIESVELLKDGGSAIYGSDAVAGVLNIKLRKDYQGTQAAVSYADYFNTSASVKMASILAGATSGKASVLVAANWREQGGIQARDLYYTRNADNTAVAHKAKPYYAITGPGDISGILNTYGFTNPIDDEWFDNRSGTGYPGYVKVGGATYTFAEPTTAPTTGDAVNGQHLYNYQEDTNFLDERRTYSFYTRGQYNYSEYLVAALEVSLVHNESKSNSAAAPASLAAEFGDGANGRMIIPAHNPYNPWGVDLSEGARRLVETNGRYNDVSSDSPRILFTLGGKLPEFSIFQDWNWEVGVLYSRSSVTNTNPGTVPDYKLQQALNGLVSDGKGGLTYDPRAALNNRVYFNWFGVNDAAMGDFLSVTNPIDYKNQLTSYDFRADGPIAHLPAGDIGLSIGAEHYVQKQSVSQTDLNETGNVVGGAHGMGWQGSRTVNAVYAEIAVPITKWLEAQVAGRYETYSDDGFQERVRPKVGIKIRPLDWLLLRASYAQSYKAPDLAYLYASQTVTFTSSMYADPGYLTDPKKQLEVHVVGDRNLKPETTDTYYVGIAVEPQRGKLKGFTASVDFFRYQQKNLLSQFTSFYSYNSIMTYALQGLDPFVSMVIRADPLPGDTGPGQLLYIENPYTNISDRHQVGYDFEASYRWHTDKWGDYRVSAQGTYTHSDKINGNSALGNAISRRFNGNVGLSWKRRDWSANVNCFYIRGAKDNMTLANFGGDYGIFYIGYKIKDQYIFNGQITYSGFWRTNITLGVTNIFNQRPPVDPTGSGGAMADGVNWTLPAMWTLKISKSF
ncbi:TonB-dependent receptor plug domain-containing protein [Ereboglobus luteus]|uniref:TonB-dependent receptor plug domain-containing protein n=1 Tax=Ereboglobus luteus TaxID=1796921 RepID=A0A2U8E4S8_9BACT|nr:TonB-dependent receptor [Ereboglobus luteus]AWI09867.1 hypothetical protein CKA38_11955 [Ereboglobus luteus]